MAKRFAIESIVIPLYTKKNHMAQRNSSSTYIPPSRHPPALREQSGAHDSRTPETSHIRQSAPNSNLTLNPAPESAEDCRPPLPVPLASTVPAGINHGRGPGCRLGVGAKSSYDLVGSLPGGDGSGADRCSLPPLSPDGPTWTRPDGRWNAGERREDDSYASTCT